MELPDDTRVYCGHEYTVKNLDFAASLEPGNTALAQRLSDAKALREKGLPTIPSTLGEERRTNPFLRVSSPELRQTIGKPNADDVEVFAEIRRRRNSW